METLYVQMTQSAAREARVYSCDSGVHTRCIFLHIKYLFPIVYKCIMIYNGAALGPLAARRGLTICFGPYVYTNCRFLTRRC
uniref:Uncharacterized protein n=1 Tax=Papilio xuthus TaxID=66420 RepID=I4DKK0_PAPXU|nr:unknown unsecreted protein [Papilio xuthus]